MFCPSCGIEDTQANQYCRACGTEISRVRLALESTDAVTASAATAREEIGRAFAARIRAAQTGVDLKIVAEDVLPEVEKFLESPAEKRMRRLRTGTLIALIGLGAMLGFLLVSQMMGDSGILILAGFGMVAFFIGLAFFVNGLFLTMPKKAVSDRSSDAAKQRRLDTHVEELATRADESDASTNELMLPAAKEVFISVTEETTRHLKEKQPAAPRR